MSRPFLRLIAITFAGFFGGCLGLGLVAALDATIGLQTDGGGTLLLLFLAAFVGGIFGGVRIARRLTTTWVEAPFAGGAATDQASLRPAPGEGPAATGPLPFESNDELHRVVRTPPAPKLPPGLVLVGSFVIFLISSERTGSFGRLAILAGVLLFHEAGHALGMIALGYRDVRIFFIPFLGAATSGKPEGGQGWRQGVVLLLGPMPGIIAGGALAFVAGSRPTTTAGYAARTLIYVNIFNLLPVMPLDGGRLFDLLIFGRNRITQLLWRLLAALAFVLLGLRLEAPLLGVLAFLQLIGIPGIWAVTTAAAALLRGDAAIPLRVEAASDALIDEVHERHLEARWGKNTTGARATWIRMVIEQAANVRSAPGLAGSLALFAAWALCIVVAWFTIGISARGR